MNCHVQATCGKLLKLGDTYTYFKVVVCMLLLLREQGFPTFVWQSTPSVFRQMSMYP